MEGIKEKGLLRRFLDWLKTPDEDEVVDGELNIKAFKDEELQTLQELKNTSKSVNNMGNGMFIGREKHRKETVNNIKADVKTPNMNNKGKQKPIIENYLEQ